MQTAANIAFDEGRHEYRVADVLFPSVTAVLGIIGEDWSAVPASILDAAADFGRNVHTATHLHDTGALDRAALDPLLEPYLQQYERFLAETGAVVVASEQPVAHAALRYAGTPDKVLVIGSRECPVDVKTTAVVPPTVGPQTAAYAQAIAAGRPARANHLMRNRYCLHLRADDYRFIHLKESTDWNVFQAALTIYRWREKHA